MDEIKNCPECGDDLISVNSSSSMRVSAMRCGICGFSIQANVCEEALVKRWNKLDRANMPVLEDD